MNVWRGPKLLPAAEKAPKSQPCLFFPGCFAGGFGAAKNLCTWAVQGKDCSVIEEVKTALQAFHSEGKAIGLCCISPVLAAKVFPGCEVTVGVEKDDK